jgi:hypothetical protein
MKTHWMAGLALVASLVNPVLAADKASIEELARLSGQVPFTGLIGVYVLITDMDPEAEKDGLAKSTIRTDVELRLRQAGIRVLNSSEWLATPGSPDLFLRLSTLKPKEGPLYAFGIQLGLVQRVRLARDPNITVMAVTWEATGRYGTIATERLSELRAEVRDMVDEFINNYMAANPKQ